MLDEDRILFGRAAFAQQEGTSGKYAPVPPVEQREGHRRAIGAPRPKQPRLAKPLFRQTSGPGPGLKKGAVRPALKVTPKRGQGREIVDGLNVYRRRRAGHHNPLECLIPPSARAIIDPIGPSVTHALVSRQTRTIAPIAAPAIRSRAAGLSRGAGRGVSSNEVVA